MLSSEGNDFEPWPIATPHRSGGLRVLEVLGYVDIERAGNTLRQVRLLKDKALVLSDTRWDLTDNRIFFEG
jgi:hypothetical protein